MLNVLTRHGENSNTSSEPSSCHYVHFCRVLRWFQLVLLPLEPSGSQDTDHQHGQIEHSQHHDSLHKNHCVRSSCAFQTSLSRSWGRYNARTIASIYMYTSWIQSCFQNMYKFAWTVCQVHPNYHAGHNAKTPKTNKNKKEHGQILTWQFGKRTCMLLSFFRTLSVQTCFLLSTFSRDHKHLLCFETWRDTCRLWLQNAFVCPYLVCCRICCSCRNQSLIIE